MGDDPSRPRPDVSGELVFDVTSSIGTAVVVAVSSRSPDADALRAAVATEHEACHPEYGAVSVRKLWGLRALPDGSGVSQWIPITTTALRHRTFTWLMAQLDVSPDVPGAAEEMEFASPAGMRLTNRSTWESILRDRGGMLSPLAANASPSPSAALATAHTREPPARRGPAPPPRDPSRSRVSWAPAPVPRLEAGQTHRRAASRGRGGDAASRREAH